MGVGQVFGHEFLQREQIAAERKSGAEEQGTEGNDRPVKGNFGCQAARARYFEDEVEAVFNGGEHQNGGNGNADDTDGGQLGGSVNEFGKILADFLFNGRNEVAEQKFLYLFFDTVENRKSRKNSQTDSEKRHDGNERSIAQRSGYPEDGVVLGAAAQKKQKFAGGFEMLFELKPVFQYILIT